jgi:hypothetical protein
VRPTIQPIHPTHKVSERILIAQRLPLEDARRAHEMLGEGGALGKIVLLPNG